MKVISEALRYSKDPRISPMTSVMDVEVAPDLKTCKVWVTVMGDDEDRARIERHRRERQGLGFRTIECGRDIDREIEGREGVFLIDSVTALLSNEMFRNDGTVDAEASIRISERLSALVKNHDGLIFVSDSIYCDGGNYDELTKGYIEGLAIIDKALAKVCDSVIEMTFGFPIEYKEVAEI